MFCPKCGTKALDGATFCQKCGAPLVVGDTAQQEPTSAPVRQTQPQAQNAPSDMPKKKKSKKLPIILGAVALVIVAIIVIAMNWNGKTDYEATVRAYTPYANNQGLPYSCGEVFDKYIPDAKWKVRKSGDVAYVDISGTAKGTEKELVVTMQVEEADDQALIDPVLAKVDGRETSTQKEMETVFFAFFVAYDEKYDDLSNFAKLLNEVDVITAAGALGESGTGNSVKFPLVVSTDAMDIFAEWAAKHPSVGDYHLDLISDDDVDDQGNKIFLFTLETGGAGVFNMSIRKSDGYMEYISKFDTMSMDEWYDGIFGGDDVGAAGASEENASEVTYYVEYSESYSEGYEPAVMLYQDGRFSFLANVGEGVGFYNGTYSVTGDIYTFNVTETEFSGNKTSFEFEFAMQINGNTLIYESDDMLGLTMKGSVFSLSATPPKSIMDASSFEGTYEGDPSEGNQASNNYINDSFEWVETPTGNTDHTIGTTTVNGVVKNTSTKTYSYVQISFNLYDSSGNQIDTATATIRNLKAGGTWGFDAVAFSGDVSRFDFASIDAI